MGLIPVLFFCVRYENVCELKNVVVSYLSEKQLMEKISCFFCIIFYNLCYCNLCKKLTL